MSNSAVHFLILLQNSRIFPMKAISILWMMVIFLLACKPAVKEETESTETVDQSPVRIEILDSDVEQILSKAAQIKTIARGFNWAEGPLWLKEEQALIFSDVPENKIYRWSEPDSLSIWLEPSGYTGPPEKKREGSNGLLLDQKGRLILCQHGDRRIALMDTSTSAPKPRFITIADEWRNKRLNSPNDAAFFKGELFFTDPPYGLPGQDEDPEKELGINGVYRIGNNGLVILVENSLTRPNGIAFNETKNVMYVANSDPGNAVWMKYDMTDKNKPVSKVLFDATEEVGKANGLPDGLKVHPSGYVFATGPGGVWIFSPEDRLSARIHIPQATANCAFDDTFSHLFIAADSTMISVSLETAPLKK